MSWQNNSKSKTIMKYMVQSIKKTLKRRLSSWDVLMFENSGKDWFRQRAYMVESNR